MPSSHHTDTGAALAVTILTLLLSHFLLSITPALLQSHTLDLPINIDKYWTQQSGNCSQLRKD